MKRFVVWTNELDARLSKKYGRIVPKTLAVDAPSADEIIQACKELGINVVSVEKEKCNPRLSGLDENLRTRGMLVLEGEDGKSATLRKISQKIREFRKAKSKKRR